MTATLTFANRDQHSVTIDAAQHDRILHQLHGLTWAMMRVNDVRRAEDMRDRYRHLFPPHHHLQHLDPVGLWPSSFRAVLRTHADAELMLPDGGTWSSVMLNTAIAAGSYAIEMLARIVGTADIHGYIPAGSLPWAADFLGEILDANILDVTGSWGHVVELLRSSSGPVVMSTSDHPFPMLPPGPHRAVPGVKYREAWDRDTPALAGRSLDITASVMGNRGFGNGWSVFDVERHLDRATS